MPPAKAHRKPGTTVSHGNRLIRPILAALGLGIFFFILHTFLDRVWLPNQDVQVYYVLHVAGHVGSALIVATVVGWMIIKKSPGLLATTPDEEYPQRSQHVVYAKWFVAMRWIAVLFAGFMIFISVQVFEWLPAAVWWPLVITTITLAGFNFLYTFLLRSNWHVPLLLAVQGYIDLVILVVLLHFSGGIENTLSGMMIFHVIIGGVLLSRRQCYGIATAASLLFALMAFGEWGGVFKHYNLSLFPHVQGHMTHETPYVLSWVALQTAMLFLVAYFVTTLAERIRSDERRLERQRQQYRRQVIAATEEERKRVARELHDHTGQSLTSLIAQLTAMGAGAENLERREALTKLRQQVEQTLSEVHELSSALRPSSLDDVGLLAALEKHCQLCTDRFGVTVECEAVGFPSDQRFPEEVQAAVYRIVQEGITNSVRHGRSSVVSVLLQKQDNRLLVVIEDNGVGFEGRDWREHRVRGDHLGLLGIEERATLLGGSLRVESRPGAGASLFVEIPLKDGEHV